MLSPLIYDNELVDKISSILEHDIGAKLDRGLRSHGPGTSTHDRWEAIGLAIQAYHSGYLRAGSGHELVYKACKLYDLLAEDRSAMGHLNRTPAHKRMWKAVGEVLEGMQHGEARITYEMFRHLERRA